MSVTTPFSHLERLVADRFQRRHCVLCGSGTTALYLAFRALGETGQSVWFPTITCETAVNAAVFAGLTPRFLDVAVGACVSDLDSATASVPADDLLVQTHLFGQLCAPLTARTDLRVIEDAAQAYGGSTADGRPVGGLADPAILSFGEDKLVGCGGGAVLTDDDRLAKAMRRVLRDVTAEPDQREAHRAALMQEVFRARKTLGTGAEFRAARGASLHRHRDGFLAPFPEAAGPDLEQAMGAFPAIVARRAEAWSALRDRLRGHGLRHLEYGGAVAVPWRFTVLIGEGRRDAVASALLRRGLRASKLFAPLHRTYGLDDAGFPEAAEVAEQVVNVRFEDRATFVDEVVQAVEEGLE